MTVPRWLDRLWLVAIALSAAVVGTIWLILSIQRMGLPFVAGGIVLALVIRYRASLV